MSDPIEDIYYPEISMPISNLDSWLPTLQEFINHWTQVNTELGDGGPLVLLGTYSVAGLTADRTTARTW